MDTQPIEILRLILGNLTNLELTRYRKVCHKWKDIIEKNFFNYTSPTKHDCIILADYYYFGKHLIATPEKVTGLCDEEYLICRKLAELKNDPIFLKRYFKARILKINGYPNGKLLVETLTMDKLFQMLMHNGDSHSVKFFIKQNIINFNKRELFLTSIDLGRVALVQFFIEIGEDVHYNHDESFIRAATHDKLLIGKLLIEHGVNYNVVMQQSMTMRTKYYVIKFIIELGFQIDYDKTAALQASIIDIQDINLVRFFTKQGANVTLIDLRLLQGCANYHGGFIQQLIDADLVY